MLTLTGSNTYSGATIINSGATLQLGSGGATGSIGNTSGVTDSGILAFNLSGTATFAPVISSGAGGLTQMGPGVLILTSADGYGGVTTISSGTLQFGSGASGGPGSINNTSSVVDNGFLAFDSSASITSFSHNISGSGGVGQMSAGKASASRAPTPTPARRSSAPARSRRAMAGTGFCPARPS